jgi:hypothetical protein
MLCDNSGESINELFVETNEEEGEPPIGILFRLKRRLFWYTNAKKIGTFNSYNEFKDSYTSNDSIWKIIKDDFKRSREAAYRDKLSSLSHNHDITNATRESRNNSNIIRLERLNERWVK